MRKAKAIKRSPEDSAEGLLIKHVLAEQLREAIISGEVRPGERIVEATWAKRFGAAQASIREAINMLARDGFVTKVSGRSARVVDLNEQDVLHLYALRGAIEGLAARLAAKQHADTKTLERALKDMRHAAKIGDRQSLLDADLAFHVELCRLSDNRYLIEHARPILLPFFAFVRIKMIAKSQETDPWIRDIDAHQRVMSLIKEREGELAEIYTRRAMEQFAQTAFDNWNASSPTARMMKNKKICIK